MSRLADIIFNELELAQLTPPENTQVHVKTRDVYTLSYTDCSTCYNERCRSAVHDVLLCLYETDGRTDGRGEALNTAPIRRAASKTLEKTHLTSNASLQTEFLI